MEGMKLRWILGRAEAAAAANRVTCFARWARRAVCISMVLGKGKCLASGDLFGAFLSQIRRVVRWRMFRLSADFSERYDALHGS